MTTLGKVTDFGASGQLGELAVAWLSWCQKSRGRTVETLRAYSTTMEAMVGWFGDRHPQSISRVELDGFVHRERPRVGKQASPATLRREIATVRSFYQWCVEDGVVAPPGPAAGLHGPPAKNVNPRPIDDDVWQVWWGHSLPDDLRVALGLGFYVGLRRAEIMSVTAAQVDDDSIHGFRRKGGGEHTVPWREMWGVIGERLPHLVDGDNLFPEAIRACRDRNKPRLLAWWVQEPQEVNRRILRWGKRHGLPLFTPHQLRHSAATNLLRAGVPLHLVASLLNHSDPSITMRYVRAGGGELAEWRRNLAGDG